VSSSEKRAGNHWQPSAKGGSRNQQTLAIVEAGRVWRATGPCPLVRVHAADDGRVFWPSFQQVTQLVLRILMFSALAVGLALLLALVAARAFSMPILRLAEATHEIAAGHFDRRVSTEGLSFEVAELAEDFNRMSDTVESYMISPRFGVTGSVDQMGDLAVYIGASYLSADVRIVDQIRFDTSGVPGLDAETTLDFDITQKNKDRWNYLLGFNWDVSRSWSVHAEIAAGGSREQILGSVTWRF